MKHDDISPEILQVRELLAKARVYRGILRDVAAATGLSFQHVHKVLTGNRYSPRVFDALTKEIRRRERKAERQQKAA